MLKLTVTIVHIWKRLPGEGFGRVRVELGLRLYTNRVRSSTGKDDKNRHV